MAEPRHRRLRRLGLVFASALALHAGVLFWAASDRARLFGSVRDAAQRATPVSFVPLPEPPRKDRSQRRRSFPTPPQPSAAIVAPKPAQAIAGPQLALAESLGPTAPLASSALPGAGDITPGDPESGADGSAYPINPGYWEVVEHWLFVDRKERYCLEPQNIVRFMAAPCNHIYHCSYPVEVFDADTYHFEGVITGSGTRLSVKGGGRYTPTSLHVSARFDGHYKVLPVVLSGSLDGQFLGAECPAGAKRIRQR